MCVTSLGWAYDKIRKRRCQYSREFKQKRESMLDWGHIDPMVPERGQSFISRHVPKHMQHYMLFMFMVACIVVISIINQQHVTFLISLFIHYMFRTLLVHHQEFTTCGMLV
jgi:hypothetical protein